MPGEEYYAATKITHIKGDLYFCSERAARAAVWRKPGENVAQGS
jgi:hypothetical protein